MFLLMVLLLCMFCVLCHIFQSQQLVLININYCCAESLVFLAEACNRKTNNKVVTFRLKNKSTAMKYIICRSVLDIGDLVKFKSR